MREERPRATVAPSRLGVLGGMFNPPHLGHLALARAAAEQLDLDRVLLVPTLIPPHKPAKWDPGAEHRLEMLRLALDGYDRRLQASSLELERPGPSYTVDTLRAIQKSQPDARVTLIVGADMARTLGGWRESREIARRARLAVAEREGTSREQVLDALRALGAADRVSFVSLPGYDISSSLVRRRIAGDESIEGLVGERVAAYIREHALYGPRPAVKELAR